MNNNCNCKEISSVKLPMMNINNADRLSALPDDAVIYILSQFETKFAVQSSILSKRWENLWKLLPVLNLDIHRFRDPSTFEKFVIWILSYRCQWIDIDNFILTTEHESSISYIHTVLDYVLSHNVRHLTLKSKIRCYLIDLYSSHTLKTLDLRYADYPSRTMCFVKLEIIVLNHVYIECSEPFSGCPNLKKLTMVHCIYYNENPFTISAPQLLTLGLSDCDIRMSSTCFDPLNKVIVSTPKLTSFRFQMANPMQFRIDYIDFVANVLIDMGQHQVFFNSKFAEEMLLDLIYLLKRLSNAKTVVLSLSVIELLSMFPHVLEREAPPFRNLKSLKIIRPQRLGPYQFAPHVANFLLNPGMRMEHA